MVELVLLLFLLFVTWLNYKTNKLISIVCSLFCFVIGVFYLTQTETPDILDQFIVAFVCVTNLIITIMKLTREY